MWSVRKMTTLNQRIELPLVEPIYSTYHNQGSGAAVLGDNPSINNWYLNQVMILTCSRKFLNGFTTPEIGIAESSWQANPYLEKRQYHMQFLEGYTNSIIRRLLDAGYYVCFQGVDDYYVEGKSWYHTRHMNHDGCICGYDQNDKTFCIYSYDQNWIYQKFWTPQKSFDRGRKELFKKGVYGSICGIKPKEEQVDFSPESALRKIGEYLDSNMDKYPEIGEGPVRGIVVHDYIAKYIDKLYDGSIPYERMDRRVFRLIWEHKKAMLQRIEKIESAMLFDHSISETYKTVVREADNCRMLYAAHHMKQRNSALPIIKQKLLSLKLMERTLLEELLQKGKGKEKE